MPIGETKWDPLVKVHNNSQFIYRSPKAQMMQKFMKIDYIPLFATILTLLPGPWFALVVAIPCFLYAVCCFIIG